MEHYAVITNEKLIFGVSTVKLGKLQPNGGYRTIATGAYDDILPLCKSLNKAIKILEAKEAEDRGDS